MKIKPNVKFLNNELIQKIISESITILTKSGVTIHNKKILSILSDSGLNIDKKQSQVKFNQSFIETVLKQTSPFKLFDVHGEETHDFSTETSYFTPGSSAINILDPKTNQIRKPLTADYVQFTKVVDQLTNINSQSTAFIPSDITQEISDSFRLYLNFMFGNKPVVTGAFTIESLNLMKKMQIIIRGSEKELAKKPLTIFSCCPTTPLKWGEVSSQNLLDLSLAGIPIEIVPMPLAGFTSPVTLVGTLILHTAEILSGLAISQTINPGTPVLWGGSPAIFDIRYETTPMGAVETQMIDCANNEIGSYLKLPTQAYIALSDSKMLDAQAGLESAMGSTLASLSGINNISGPGMLDFENCQSISKLILDHEICKLSNRLMKGIEPKDDFPALPHLEELLKDKHLLISKHTRKHLKEEISFPGTVINRANLSRWKEDGESTLIERANREVDRLVKQYEATGIEKSKKVELTKIMENEAKKYGMDKLPPIDKNTL